MDKDRLYISILIFCFCAVLCIPDTVFASTLIQPGSTTGKFLCTVAAWFTGNAGKAVACLGILIIGMGALFGKVTWGTAVIVGVGIALLFGADAIITAFGFVNCHGNFSQSGR